MASAWLIIAAAGGFIVLLLLVGGVAALIYFLTRKGEFSNTPQKLRPRAARRKTGLTTDPEKARNSGLRPDGQQNVYAVLSEEERGKGFVRPVFRQYKHLKCGKTTTMDLALCETYARNPKFYGGTFCCYCGSHFPLRDANGHNFEWPDGTPVGSTAEEAEAILALERPRATGRRE